MKIALITDTHFGARNDSLIFTDFFRKFYENIFFPTLKERGIKSVIHLGDVGDRRKFINYKTLNSIIHNQTFYLYHIITFLILILLNSKINFKIFHIMIKFNLLFILSSSLSAASHANSIASA